MGDCMQHQVCHLWEVVPGEVVSGAVSERYLCVVSYL